MTPELRDFHRKRLAALKQNPSFRDAHRLGMLNSSRVGASTPRKRKAVAMALIESIKPEARAAAAQSMLDSGHYARQGKKNADRQSKLWLLVSPQNVVYEFRNLSDFIRKNSSLFDPEDVVWTKYSCRAVHGIAHLRPTRKKPESTWKGWRWQSIEERLSTWCGVDTEKQIKLTP